MVKSGKKDEVKKTAKKTKIPAALADASPPSKLKSKPAEEKEIGEKRSEIALEIRRKGMEQLSGSDTKVDSTIMIMTEEGWKSIKINRSKINY